MEPIRNERPQSPEGYSYTQLRELITLTLDEGISVLVRGHPGVGKSSLAQEIAEDLDLPIIDIRLAQRDPAELCGVHFPDRERQVLSLYPPEWVRQACDAPALVFLDEINAAVTRLHQAAAYQIVLEKRVGPFVFHPETRVMAAGNLEEDNAIVIGLSSALCNRFAHFILQVSAQAWLSWAAGVGIDPVIRAYVARHGESVLYENNGADAFPTPRSWEMASRVYRRAPEPLRRRAVAACIGPAAAEKLATFLKIYGRVDAEGIVRRGKQVNFTKGTSKEPSFIFAAVFAVGSWLCAGAAQDDVAAKNVAKFLRSPGLDAELVFMFLRQIRDLEELMTRLRAVGEFQALANLLVTLRTELYR